MSCIWLYPLIAMEKLLLKKDRLKSGVALPRIGSNAIANNLKQKEITDEGYSKGRFPYGLKRR